MNLKLIWNVSGFETLTGIVNSPRVLHNKPEATSWYMTLDGRDFLSIKSLKNEDYKVECRLFWKVIGPLSFQADVSMCIFTNNVIVSCETNKGNTFSVEKKNFLNYISTIVPKNLYLGKFESEFEDNCLDEYEKAVGFVFYIGSSNEEEDDGDFPDILRLSEDLLNLSRNPLFSDFELVFSTGESIRVHRAILAARIPKLMELRVGDDPTRSIETEKVIPFELLKALVPYIYSGNLEGVYQLGGTNLWKRLLVAVDDLNLYHLREHICQEIEIKSWGSSYKVVMKCSLPLVKFDIETLPYIVRECIVPMSGSATLQLGCFFRPDQFGMMWLHVFLDFEKDEGDTSISPVNIQWRLYIGTSEDKYFFGEYLCQGLEKLPTETEIASLRMLMNPKLPFRANKELQLTFYLKVSRLEFGSSISENENIKFLRRSKVDLDNYTDRIYHLEQFCDCTITSGLSICRAHKAILATRSPVFKELFENQPDGYNYVVENINSNLFEFMYYLYTGIIEQVVSDEVTLIADLSRYQLLPPDSGSETE